MHVVSVSFPAGRLGLFNLAQNLSRSAWGLQVFVLSVHLDIFLILICCHLRIVLVLVTRSLRHGYIYMGVLLLILVKVEFLYYAIIRYLLLLTILYVMLVLVETRVGRRLRLEQGLSDLTGDHWMANRMNRRMSLIH